MFFLDFEDKLENLNTEKEILIKSSKVKNIDISSKIKTIESKELKELEKIYKNLSPWQIVKIARHPKRPKTLDYIHNLLPILLICLVIDCILKINLLLAV